MDISAIQDRLDSLLQNKDITETEYKYLLKPEQEKAFTIKYVDEDGDTHQAKAYRTIYNNDRGPGKGGIRFHPNVDRAEVRTLSFWMALKTSLADIPLGGAKGGVAFNPKEASQETIHEISRQYIKALINDIGPNKDIPAPDVYTNPEIMAVMLDEYEKQIGKHAPGVITGKPLAVGGSKGRSTATATGAAYITQAHTEPGTVAIQGFGNAGSVYAELLEEAGYTIVAVSDSKGGIYNEDGLDIQSIKNTKEKHGSVTDAEEQRITNEELLELPVDVLGPAALEDVITQDNAENIQAQTIIELANGPVSSEADTILKNNDVDIIPDILANSGGVIVSYYEWVQNRTGDQWTAEEVDSRLKTKILQNYEAVKTRLNGTYRETAYRIATKRILEAATLRGKL